MTQVDKLGLHVNFNVVGSTCLMAGVKEMGRKKSWGIECGGDQNHTALFP